MDSVITLLEGICVIARNKINPDHRDGEASRRFVGAIIANLDSLFSLVMTKQKEVAISFSKAFVIPGWEYFHFAFSYLDACRFTLATLGYLLSCEDFMALVGPDVLRKQAAHLREIIGKLCKSIRQHAVELRKRLQEPDAVQTLVQVILGHPADLKDPVGKELRNLVDEPWIGEIADKMLTSSIESLNGISNIKVF